MKTPRGKMPGMSGIFGTLGMSGMSGIAGISGLPGMMKMKWMGFYVAAAFLLPGLLWALPPREQPAAQAPALASAPANPARVEVATEEADDQAAPSDSMEPMNSKGMNAPKGEDRSAAIAEAPTINVPLMRYGLGTLACAAYSPNPAVPLIATGGGIGAVLWDANTGKQKRILAAPGHYVASIAFSPDGRRILTGSGDNTAKLWDTETGALIRTFSGHASYVSSVAYSLDGRRVLTGSGDKTAKLWDAESGSLIRTFSMNTRSIESVALSPDGRRVLTGSTYDSTANLWDAETGALIRTSFGDPVYSIIFSPDGRRVLLGSDGRAYLLDAETGSLIRTFSGHAWPVESVAFSPDGSRVLTGSWDKIAKLWDAETGSLIRTISGHTGPVESVAFSPDGRRVLTGSEDQTAKLWDAETGSLIRIFSGHTDYVSSVAFSPDGRRVLTGSGDATAKLWDAETGSLIRTFSGHTDVVLSVAFSPSGRRVLTGSVDATAKLWDAETGALIRTFSGHTGSVASVAYSPDSRGVLTGSGDNTAKLWDAETGTLIRTFSGHIQSVNSVAYSPDGGRVLTGSDDETAKLWDAETGSLIRTFSGHTHFVGSVAFSPDGRRVLTGSYDATAKLWDAETGSLIRTFSGNTSSGFSVAFSPDGGHVLTGSGDNTAELWDAETGSLIRTFSGHTSAMESVAFSPDGRRVLTSGDDGLVLLWPSGLSGLRTKEKLILVAGGGPYVGNGIAEQTHALAEQAYHTATIRGMTPENIQYLSAFETSAQNSKVDGPATQAAVENAIRTWASDAVKLTILLIDHGSWNDNGTLHDPSDDEWYFILNESPRDSLSTHELKEMIDAAQTEGDPLPEAVVIIDACYSGGFLKGLAPAPAGTKRIVITSTKPDRVANMSTSSGYLSFASVFLSYALRGVSLKDCFQGASEVVTALNSPSEAPQAPMLDADGDGLWTPAIDGPKLQGNALGNLPAFAPIAPMINNAAPDQTLSQPESVTLWAELSEETTPDRVEAILTHSGDTSLGGGACHEPGKRSRSCAREPRTAGAEFFRPRTLRAREPTILPIWRRARTACCPRWNSSPRPSREP